MSRFSPKLSTFHSEVLQQTELGQLCGQTQKFRDRYEILRILGRGGFGITFLAKDAVLPGNPLCVIKQLCPKTSNPRSWERACQRFEKEAKILGQLGSHSQIPMLLDYFQTNGQFYLIQEYIRGSTLARDVRRNGTKSEAEVKNFLQEIMPVLRYIHKHRVIHRDIKPQNLLHSKDDGRLVLIDFGAVKEELIKNSENSTRTASTNFVGTMGFAPPEQFALRPVYASDIYAVGVTCLYLLTGKAPLEFDHDVSTGEIIWQRDIQISEHFGKILSKMLRMSLDQRWKSADEVIWALGLESHIPSLAKCLTNKPLGGSNKIATSTGESSSQVYMSPLAREATAIREWKAKLRGKKE